MSKKYIDIEVFDGDDDIKYVRHKDMLNLLEQIRIKQEEKDKENRRLYIALRNREQEIERLNKRIDKAIEYIENKNKFLDRENYYQVFEYRDIYLMPLLDILKGSDKE